jgi:hypothetical protein
MSRWLFVTVIVLAFGLPVTGQTPNPHLGTWKVNVAKSKRDPSATPLNATSTRKYEVFEGDGLKLTVDSVDANGKHVTGGWAGHFDGKPNKDLGNNPWDSVAVKRVDAYTYEATQLSKGKVYSSNIASVSKDGKTLTVTSKRTDAAGKTITNITVYDKQ